MTDTKREGTVGGLPKSTLYDMVYEILGSCYSPEAALNGDVKESATQDIFKIIDRAVEEAEVKMVLENFGILQDERARARTETLLELLQMFNDYDVPLTMTAEQVRDILEEYLTKKG